jgi:hypothetical protein
MRFLLLALGAVFFLSSFKMADRLLEAQKGDYIVTEQDRTYSLLFVRENQAASLILEEVAIPVDLANSSITNWKDWMKEGAPRHTSWVQYEIDPKTLELIEGYSFSKTGWLYLEESDHFLSKLLSLPLSKISAIERKKIGIAPKNDEPDLRKTWNPPVFVEGKKTKTPCEAWNTKWPKDNSILSSCTIQLYFPPKELSTFPAWIEASNGHFQYAIKVIDSGKDMQSSLNRLMPHRPPKLLRAMQKNSHFLELPIHASSYYKSFALFALDIQEPHKRIGPIPFQLQNGDQKEERILSISLSDLSSFLQENHRYKWLLAPQTPEAFFIESDDFFRFALQK